MHVGRPTVTLFFFLFFSLFLPVSFILVNSGAMSALADRIKIARDAQGDGKIKMIIYYTAIIIAIATTETSSMTMI